MGTKEKGNPAMTIARGSVELVKVDLPSEFTPFSRAELILCRERAKVLAQRPGRTLEWARAYWALADAADRLDAMQARTMVVLSGDKPIEAS